MKTWRDLVKVKYAIALIVIIAAITWSSSVTSEFSGYDDIKLIVNNERIHKGPLYTAKFYGNIVSDSHNVAWTNYPTVIYRPLEWFGSAVGYSIWGPNAVPFHIFFNCGFHIINGILLFFILLKAFRGKEHCRIEEEDNKKKGKGKKAKSKSFKDQFFAQADKEVVALKEQSPKTILLATIITTLWIVHPLHNEAVNMLTSGVGFLWATFFMLSAITINLYVHDYSKLKNLLLLAISFVCFIISYLGSEMALIGPICLFFFYLYEKIVFNKNFDWLKTTLALLSLPTYLSHRASIVSETHAWASSNASEFIERLTVLAPEIFFHYIKLFFYPGTLSIDQHHQVLLKDAFSTYHLLCFVVALSFVVGIFYYFITGFKTPKEEFVRRQNHFIIGFGILLAGLSIGIALNIIPLYVLARERYCYIFVLSLFMMLVVMVYEYFFAHNENCKIDLDQEINFAKLPKKLFTVLVIFALWTTALSVRSFVRNLDWRNGESIWTQTIESVKDIGVKQVWRYRLIDYYRDPGTDTFEPDPETYKKTLDDFVNFIPNHNLANQKTFDYWKNKNENNKILEKYGYEGRKTVASGLFFNGMRYSDKKEYKKAFATFRLAHNYYPEHFQVNVNLLVHLHDKDEKTTNFLIDIMDKEASNNPFLAKGFMDTMHLIKHPRYYELAKKYKQINPNTQVFDVYLFNSSYLSGRYSEAYKAAKRIVQKYHEEKTYDQFLRAYERGAYKDNIKEIGKE